ncbi:hypothetical protein [Streptomyces sp. NPDC055085]
MDEWIECPTGWISFEFRDPMFASKFQCCISISDESGAPITGAGPTDPIQILFPEGGDVVKSTMIDLGGQQRFKFDIWMSEVGNFLEAAGVGASVVVSVYVQPRSM